MREIWSASSSSASSHARSFPFASRRDSAHTFDKAGLSSSTLPSASLDSSLTASTSTSNSKPPPCLRRRTLAVIKSFIDDRPGVSGCTRIEEVRTTRGRRPRVTVEDIGGAGSSATEPGCEPSDTVRCDAAEGENKDPMGGGTKSERDEATRSSRCVSELAPGVAIAPSRGAGGQAASRESGEGTALTGVVNPIGASVDFLPVAFPWAARSRRRRRTVGRSGLAVYGLCCAPEDSGFAGLSHDNGPASGGYCGYRFGPHPKPTPTPRGLPQAVSTSSSSRSGERCDLTRDCIVSKRQAYRAG